MTSPARPVGPVALLALGVNGIVGVGIFFAPADIAARVPGPGSVLVFAATACALLPVALVFARLGRVFDVDGGPVVFARAAFGETAGFAVGWITYLSALFSLAAVMAGMTAASGPALGIEGPVALRVAASAMAIVLAAVVAAGLAVSARTWTALTVLKLLPLLALAALFLVSPATLPAASTVTPPVSAWLAAGLTAVFALQGFEIVPVIAGRSRSPERSVPFATVASLVGAAALYLVLQAAAVSALPHLASSGAPLAETSGVLGGPLFMAAVGAGTSVSALGIAFGMTVTAPHYLAALARGTLHGGLDDVDASGVPRRSLLVTVVLVVLVIQAGDRGQLFALASLAVLTQYVTAALALLALCVRRAHGLSPRQAWPALPAVLVGVCLVGGASWREAMVAAAALSVGLLVRATAGVADTKSVSRPPPR